MKREILFRGQSVNHGSFEYGDLITSLNDVFIGNTVGNSPNNWCKVYPESVGQWTGLTDKNGTKIFEGDIVDVDTSGVGGSFEDGIYKVDYLLPDCAFALVQLDESNGISFNECYLYTITGNIYETT